MRKGQMDASVVPSSASGGGEAPASQNVNYAFFAHRGSGGAGLTAYYAAVAAGGVAVTSVATTVDTLFAVPFVIGTARTADRMYIRVSTSGGAGSQFRFGFYNNQSDTVLYPTSLIVDSGVRDGTVTGFHEVTISVAFATGLYWGAFICGTGAPNIFDIAATTYYPALGTDSSGALVRGYSVAQTFGALPASFPGGAAYRLATIPGSHALRYSA